MFFLSGDGVKPHCLANHRFESSDALLNCRGDKQNCKNKRDAATGNSEDYNVVVCKKHGVPSDALLRRQGLEPGGVLVPRSGGRSSRPRRHLLLPRLHRLVQRIRGLFVPFTTHAPQRPRREACMSSDHGLDEFGLLLVQFAAAGHQCPLTLLARHSGVNGVYYLLTQHRSSGGPPCPRGASSP